MARHKYKFKDRKEAEQAYIDADAESIRLNVALSAVAGGTAEWLPGNYGTPTSYYRFAIVRRRFETLIVCTFINTQTGQAPSACVYGVEFLQDALANAARFTPTDDEGRGYRTGLYALAARINEISREELAA